jgi:hypothetical protein
MSGDGRVDEVAAEPPQARKGPVLVGAGEPAVTNDIRNQDRRELPGLAHCAPPAPGTLAQTPAGVCRNAASFQAEGKTGGVDPLLLQEKAHSLGQSPLSMG